jgi:phosphotransferase system enzyme I (PtsP)
MAGRPLEAFALIALGFRRLSAPASGIGRVKRMILTLDLARAEKLIAPLLSQPRGSVRGEVEALARKLNLTL